MNLKFKKKLFDKYDLKLSYIFGYHYIISDESTIINTFNWFEKEFIIN
jgi:hypothetical protein